MNGSRSAVRVVMSAGTELVIWPAALIWLALLDPGATHFTLCPLALLGISWCPGCGLGHAISYVLHGEFAQSFHAHVLGIPAVLVLIFRIITLIREAHLRGLTPDFSLSHEDSTHGQYDDVFPNPGKR